jgi:hypothetical protein
MEETLISKVENKGLLRVYRMSKIGLPIMMLSLLFKLYFGIQKTSTELMGFWLIVVMNILSIWSFVDSKTKISKNKGIPFVEWWTDKIVFRSSKTGEEFGIMIDSILSVSIKLDEIFILTKSDKTFEINLNEYIEYDQRMTIKENFTVLSKEINNKFIANEAIS